MNPGLYAVSIPVFTRMLKNLSAVLDKGAAHAAAQQFDPAVLLAARLYPDMLPLTNQVQIAADFAKGAAARLAGVDVPSTPDVETTFDELQARIGRTIEFIGSVDPAAVDAGAQRMLTIKTRLGTREFIGLDYFNFMALPNFYFHVTTAYDILRHNGVPVGKRDFTGL